jgi:hypothetical protein
LISLGVAWSKAAEDFEDWNPIGSEKNLSSDYHVGRIDCVWLLVILYCVSRPVYIEYKCLEGKETFGYIW